MDETTAPAAQLSRTLRTRLTGPCLTIVPDRTRAVRCPCGCGADVRPSYAASLIVECDVCRRGCDCPMESAGCEHYGCWGAASILGAGASEAANTCAAYLSALATVTT